MHLHHTHTHSHDVISVAWSRHCRIAKPNLGYSHCANTAHEHWRTSVQLGLFGKKLQHTHDHYIVQGFAGQVTDEDELSFSTDDLSLEPIVYLCVHMHSQVLHMRCVCTHAYGWSKPISKIRCPPSVGSSYRAWECVVCVWSSGSYGRARQTVVRTNK